MVQHLNNFRGCFHCFRIVPPYWGNLMAPHRGVQMQLHCSCNFLLSLLAWKHAFTSCEASSQPLLIQNCFLKMRMLRFSQHSRWMSKIEKKWREIEDMEREEISLCHHFPPVSPFYLSISICALSPFSHSLSISAFSLHFLFISTFSPHFLAAWLPSCRKLWQPECFNN